MMNYINFLKFKFRSSQKTWFYILIRWLSPIVGVVISYFIYKDNPRQDLFANYFFTLVLWAIFNRMFLIVSTNIRNAKGNSRYILSILKISKLEFLSSLFTYFFLDSCVLTIIYILIGVFGFKINISVGMLFGIIGILLFAMLLFSAIGIAIESLFRVMKHKALAISLAYLILLVVSAIYIPSQIIFAKIEWFKYIEYINPIGEIKMCIYYILHGSDNIADILIPIVGSLCYLGFSLIIIKKRFMISK